MLRKSGEIIGHSAPIYDLTIHRDHLYSASGDGFVARWNIKDLTQDTFSIKCSKPPYSLVAANGHLWFGLSNGDMHVIDLEQKTEIKYFQQHRHAIFSLVSISQKNLILAGDADGNLSIWDDHLSKLLLILPLNCGKIRKINVHPDGSLFVVHGQDELIRIFETTNFNELVTLQGHENGANCSTFSVVDSKLLYSGGKDGLLKIWDWQNEQLLKSIPAHNFALYDIIEIPEKHDFVTISRDKSIKVWHTQDLEFQQKIESKQGGHKHSVNAIQCLHESRLYTASDDRKIIQWDVY